MNRFSLVLLFLLSSAAGAVTRPHVSAHREPGRSYLDYKASVVRMFSQDQPVAQRTSPEQAATTDRSQLPKATEWESTEVMGQRFESFRDLRFMTTASKPDFQRRSSWLYPDDGCFARAALAVRNLIKMSVDAPKKVFAFGNLVVQTANSPTGDVSWWYHVAPLVEVAGQKYVLDPAISPKEPLKLEDWLAKMSSAPEEIEVAVCESGAYTPGDDCSRVSDGVESVAESDQPYYLDLEWDRLVELNRNPDEELGDNPPWLRVPAYF